MTDFYTTRQRLEYALQELDGEGTDHERVTRAWLRLRDLGVPGVDVPALIANEVAAMHGTVAKWELPRQNTALESAVAWMSDRECQDAINQLHRWRNAVDEAIRTRMRDG